MISGIFLWAAATGAVAIPKPTTTKSPGQIIAENYPPEAFLANSSGVILYRVVVDPRGKPENCIVDATDLSKSDTQNTCAAVMFRFRFERPTGPDGAPTYYVYDGRTMFLASGSTITGPPPVIEPIFTIALPSLPAEAQYYGVKVSVHVAVDANGALIQCNPPTDAKASLALARLACEQLPAVWKPMPVLNVAGEPIGYIRRLSISFRETGAPAR
jgi:hypothetical protein